MSYLNSDFESIKLARQAAEHLRSAITNCWKLSEHIKNEKINLNSNESINLYAWVYIMAFMARKLCALFLGQTDYDYNIQDLKFAYLYKKDLTNENS